MPTDREPQFEEHGLNKPDETRLRFRGILTKEQNARFPHRCDYCGGEIAKRDRYYIVNGFYPSKACETCVRADQ